RIERAKSHAARRIPVLFAALLAVATPVIAQEPPPPGATIVSFGDYLWLRVDGKPVALEPGSPAYTVPLGARAVVAQGSATLIVGEALLRIDAGDDFVLSASDGQTRLLVNAGSVEAAVPGRPAVQVEAGRFSALTGPDAGTLPGAPSAPAPAAPAAAVVVVPPAVPAQPAVPAAVPVSPPVPAQVPPPAVPASVPAPAAVGAVTLGPAAPQAPAEEGWDPLAALSRAVARLSELHQARMQLVLELHPFYNLSQSYDSNIYLVPPDNPDGTRQGGGVRSSWITVNQLGTGWKLPFGKRHSLNGFYWGRLTDYSKEGRANDAADQELRASYDVKGLRGSSFSLWNDYLNTEDPAFSEQVTRQRRFSDETAFKLDLDR
ncbi:MAG: hypothetical protein KGL53_07150, partial [Elusimicrobia bacterium]|nr:hypothetical protein [Elusimicrobiota bacterium]